MLASALTLTLLALALATAQGDPFARLAIPAEQLPQGCRLAPRPSTATGERVAVPGWAALPIDSNPWRGTDRIPVAAIRSRLDPPQMVPDGPPLHPRDLAAFRRNSADGVAQAYAAVYETDDRRLVTVYAVQFESELSFDAAVSRAKRRPAYGDTATRMLVVATGDGQICLAAIDSYLRGWLQR